MGKWQKVYLERNTAETTTSRDGTVTIDLPEKDYISQLMIRLKQLNIAYTAALLPVFHTVSKLEVVDGSDVLYSLSGAQAQAISYYRGRTNPCVERNDWESTETSDIFYMRFGREPGDTKYMLDMGRYSNPQLKISYDTTTTVHDGYTYTVPTTPTIKYTVLADVLRGAPAGFSGQYISARQIYSYTAAASATEYIDIPRKDPIYGIGIRAAYTATDMANELDKVRLNINSQEWIPFDIYFEEMRQLHREWFQPQPMIEERIQVKNEIRYDSGLGECEHYQMENKFSMKDIQRVQSNTGGWFRPEMYDLNTSAASANDVPMLFFATGLFPHHMVYLPMSKVTDNGAAETLDAPATSSLKLEISSNASAGGSCVPTIVLDTVRRNG